MESPYKSLAITWVTIWLEKYLKHWWDRLIRKTQAKILKENPKLTDKILKQVTDNIYINNISSDKNVVWNKSQQFDKSIIEEKNYKLLCNSNILTEIEYNDIVAQFEKIYPIFQKKYVTSISYKKILKVALCAITIFVTSLYDPIISIWLIFWFIVYLTMRKL